MIFDTDTISSVVEHMNTDHQDACVLIARAFSPYCSASTASLISFDSKGLQMQVADADLKVHTVQIAFDKPLTRESQIRGILVAMTKNARATLE